MFQPTSASLGDTLPGNLGDPALNTWVLSWESHALVNEPTNFFNGNIFHPYGEAIKYSEMMLPVVPLFGLVFAISGSAVLAHNLAIIGLIVFCLIATYLLARRWVGPVFAVVAAVSFSFSGYVFMHQGHLQLLTLGFFPLSFLALFRALEKRRIKDGLWLGICTALLTTGSLYYGAIWCVCLFVVVLVDLVRLKRPNRQWWYTIGTASAVTAVLVGPIAFVYTEFSNRIPFGREVGGLGLNVIDFLTPAPGSLLYGGLVQWAAARQPDGISEHGFFLGFVVMSLALIGLFVLVAARPRSFMPTGEDRSRYELGLTGLTGAVALVLALGPEAKGITMPFQILADHVPGFDAIRAASRLAVPALLAAAVFAAWGLSRLLSSARPGPGIVTTALVTSAILLEMWAAPLRADVGAREPIREALESAPAGAVLELPMREVADFDFAYTEGPRMLASIGDWRPRFNGFSGGLPPEYLKDISMLSQFPADAAVQRASDLGVRYVVLHGAENESRDSFSHAQVDTILRSLPATAKASQSGSDWLVDLTPRG
jgi:hypothetical protein